MSTFSFHPDLFAHRGRAMEELAAAELHWFSDFRSIDIDHDLYGLEVCGIRDQETAELVATLLQRTFPEWRHGFMYEREYWEGDPGWQVVICRHARARLEENGEFGADAPMERADLEGLAELRRELGLDNDTANDSDGTHDADADAVDITPEEGLAAASGGIAHPILASVRQEALGDALRHAGDDHGAIRAYLEAALLSEGAGMLPGHPGHRFRMLLLSLKSAVVIQRIGDGALAERHRRLAHLELSTLVDASPARSHPVPCAGAPPIRGAKGMLTGLAVGYPGGLDPVRFESILDQATGLLNRRGLEGVLARQAADRAMPGATRTLLLIEIAHQAAIAERYGPEGLSSVCRQTGRRLLAAFHGTGLLVRWGPAAFAVLLVSETAAAGEEARRLGISIVDRVTRLPVRPLPVLRPVAVPVACVGALALGAEAARRGLMSDAERRIRV